MTGTELATRVRFYTKTNSTTFTDAEMLPIVNQVMVEEIASRIVETDAQTFSVPYTFNLVANQREYAIGDDVLNRLHKVEIKFAAADDRLPAYYLKDYRGSETEAQITDNFNNSEGGFAYTVRRRAILILSGTIIAVTNGVRAVSIVYPEKIANLTGSVGLEVDPSTTTFGFPRQFHELLARRVSIIWKSSQPKPVPLSPLEMLYEQDLKRTLAAISMVTDEGRVKAEEPTDFDSGTDGFDY
jgi:hypothetical protein